MCTTKVRLVEGFQIDRDEVGIDVELELDAAARALGGVFLRHDRSPA